MTTAALNYNLDCQVNQAWAIVALQDQIDCRDEEMDEAERNKCEAIRKPRVSTCTSALSRAMLAAGAMSSADSFGVVMGGTSGSMPKSSSAPCVFSSDVPVTMGVTADFTLGTSCGVRAPPLYHKRYISGALHRVVLGVHRTQPTTIGSPTLWEHMARFNQLRVSQGKTVP